MKNIIVANWKMNPQTYQEAEDLIKNILEGIKDLNNTEVVICPPFTWLTDFSHKNEAQILFGAQNVFHKESGAFTGEISPLMLKNSKVDYVILGHSERRKYFGETNELINQKIKSSLSVGLKVIFCVGENEGENKEEVLVSQITEGLQGISEKDLGNITVAYEPVWAIGTGKNCGIEETQDAVASIKKIIEKLYSQNASEVLAVLYGGSVKSENSGDYLKDGGVNGLLVGGASLKAEEFIKIVKSAE